MHKWKCSVSFRDPLGLSASPLSGTQSLGRIRSLRFITVICIVEQIFNKVWNQSKKLWLCSPIFAMSVRFIQPTLRGLPCGTKWCASRSHESEHSVCHPLICKQTSFKWHFSNLADHSRHFMLQITDSLTVLYPIQSSIMHTLTCWHNWTNLEFIVLSKDSFECLLILQLFICWSGFLSFS